MKPAKRFAVWLAVATMMMKPVMANTITFQFFAKPTGYGANGIYFVTLSGKEYEWELSVQGRDDSLPAWKAPLDFINLWLYFGEDEEGSIASFDPTRPVTGFNTSNGGAYWDTSPWEALPQTELAWPSDSDAKRVDPFGGNKFVGTFFMSVPAEELKSVYVLLESGQGPGKPLLGLWTGEANRSAGLVPDSGPGALFVASALGLVLIGSRSKVIANRPSSKLSD